MLILNYERKQFLMKTKDKSYSKKEGDFLKYAGE